MVWFAALWYQRLLRSTVFLNLARYPDEDAKGSCEPDGWPKGQPRYPGDNAHLPNGGATAIETGVPRVSDRLIPYRNRGVAGIGGWHGATDGEAQITTDFWLSRPFAPGGFARKMKKPQAFARRGHRVQNSSNMKSSIRQSRLSNAYPNFNARVESKLQFPDRNLADVAELRQNVLNR